MDYGSEEEKRYILRLICTALSDGGQRDACNRKLDSMEYGGGTLAGEIASTARMLSDALLVEKFVQGLPVVGVVGGAVNFSIYRRIAALAAVKYKKRYLMRKLSERG